VVPASLRQMLLKYFHDAVLSGHLGARKTFQKIAENFWWPKMRAEILRACVGVICVIARKPHMTRALSCTRLLRVLNLWKGCLLTVGPLVRTRRGNIAILVIWDAFSKFVSFVRFEKFRHKW
jgi:hypothetical protein